MANIDRVRVALTGFPGGPGVCTYYGLSGPALFPNIVALWGSIAGHLPADVSVKVENAGDTINDADGVLSGSWSIAPATGVVGADGGNYSAPTGLCITWLTDTILDGHRVKGRSFIVPMPATAYALNGTLNDPIQAAFAGFAETMVAASASNFVVWHRPRAARAATATKPARAARPGGHALITASRVVDKAAVLRSRRD